MITFGCNAVRVLNSFGQSQMSRNVHFAELGLLMIMADFDFKRARAVTMPKVRI